MIKERSLVTYILLSLVTCGLYQIYFWYQFAEDMNVICDGDGKETQNYVIVILLSLITCGIYGYIWYYGIGNRLSENAPRYGKNFTENGTTILLWLIFGALLFGVGAFIAVYILIKQMNELADVYNSTSITQV